MSSGAHLSKELHDLIKNIGETRSKQQEDKIIIQQQTKLKTVIQESGISPKKMREHMIRSIYIEMLGHDASFSHIHAVNLTQSKTLALKRIGYLCCSLFLNQNSQFLILLVANLQRDLQSTNIHEVVIALTALAKLISPMMVGGVLEPLTKLLTHTTDLVRKKAVIVMHRISQIQPGTVPDFNEQLRRALCDQQPSVMAAALNPYYEAIKANPAAYQDTCQSFVLILKQVIQHQLTRDYDYHRMPAPWVQIKILQILAIFGANDLRASEQIYEVLNMTLKRSDDTGINIGNAVTYQCVKTIATIYPNQSLLETAATAVSKFLTSESNNLKYHGINALIQIVQVDPKYVLEHSITILDCLESKDETMKQETLTLLSKMANTNNCKGIVDKLLMSLKASSEPHFKSDLVNQITLISEKFAPNQEWFIKTMNTVFEYGGQFINSDILNNFLRLIEENFVLDGEAFGIFMINTYMEILKLPTLSDIMTKIIAWVFGEIGASTYGSDEEQLREICTQLLEVITNDFQDESPRNWILNSLAKLTSCPSFVMRDELKACFDFYGRSQSLEVSQRCLDFKRLAKYNGALRLSSELKSTFDPNLSFLKDFVQKSGGKVYDENKSTRVHVTHEPEIPQIYFETQSSTSINSKSGGSGSKQDDDIKIKVRGASKWTIEGIQPEEETPQFAIQKQAEAKVTGIGSNGITTSNSGGGISGGSTTVTGTGSTTGKINAISSKEYEGAPNLITGQINNYPPVTTEQPVNNIQKKNEELNELKKQERLQEANAIFAGVNSMPTKATAPVITGYPQPTNNLPGYPGTSVNPTPAPSAAPSSSGSLNLLDMDASPSVSNPAPVKSAAPTGGPPSLFSFGSPFSPLKIDVTAYENFWGTLQIEKSQSYQSKIQSENDFKSLLNTLQIGIVEIINNEIICAGQNKQNEQVILLYGVYNNNGQLDVTAQSNQQDDINYIINTIKQKFC